MYFFTRKSYQEPVEKLVKVSKGILWSGNTEEIKVDFRNIAILNNKKKTENHQITPNSVGMNFHYNKLSIVWTFIFPKTKTNQKSRFVTTMWKNVSNV